MSLKKWIVLRKARKSVKEFEWVNEHPLDCQEMFVSRLAQMNKDTLYGRKLELERVRSVDEYQKRVPIHDYNAIQKYIRLIMSGRRDILFRGTPIWWAKTSGTTSEPKLIPVTREMAKYFSDTGSRLLYSFIMENPERNVDVLSGKLLYLRAPSTTEYINGIPAGYISGITGETQSRFARRMVVPRKEVSQLADWEKKFYLTILETIGENVTMIVGVTPLLMSMFQRMTDEYPERLIRDLRNGQTKEKVRKALKKGEGRLLPLNCWENLRLFTPSSASIKPYMRRYTELFGDIPTREAYSATEGQLGHEDEEGGGLLLHWDKYLFEFLSFQETDSARDEDVQEEKTRGGIPRERLIVSELKVGNLYELLITTPFGLYSYRIGDVLRLESKNPYRFTIVGRTKMTLNVYGEKVCEDHVSTALSAAETLTRTIVSDYSCAVAADGGSRYILYVEFIKPPKDKLKFIAAWDNKLREIAPAYACFRARDAMLKPPEMIALDKGTFQKYEERRVRGRNASGHLKPPHIISGGELPHELEIPIRTL
nr:GH3 auxin-responsive promoter family protein [Candidatus Njordarchaeota archaeon]